MPSPPASPSPPPPTPTTTQCATPAPAVPPSVELHGSHPPPTRTPAPPPRSPAPASAAEGADPVPLSVPTSATEPETENAESAPSLALSLEGPATRAADSDQPATIPRPTYKEERQAGFPFDLLGIAKYKADREPLRACVTEVYRTQAAWRTSTKTYKELPAEERGVAEQQLQSGLEKLCPATAYTADQVRACREWLPAVLLARRHRDRRNTWARRRGAA
ncbi:hypothetical protein DFP73DRAFT_221751 [Morchella snyderi]|nr:hypothetical protein DFP73DRAFT_221751 [Morchella snyderi]